MFKNKKIAIALVAAGGLVLALASFAGAETNSNTTNGASNAHPMALTVSASGQAMLRGTLQSIGSNFVVVTSWGGNWTINVNSSTTFVRRFGGTSGLLEFVIGDNIQVNGKISQSAVWTIDAKNIKNNSIQARNANFAGTISGLSGSMFTLTTPRRGDVKVTVNADARIMVNGATSTVSGLQNGMRADVKGAWNRNQSTVMASRVVARTPNAANASTTDQ